MAATNTYRTYLLYKDGGSFTKLIDIVDFPDLRGEPEMLDATTLSDPHQVNIPGILQSESKQFTANFDLANYQTLVGLEGTEREYAVFMGVNGSMGAFYAKGYLTAIPLGGGSNAVRQMRITLALTEPFATAPFVGMTATQVGGSTGTGDTTSITLTFTENVTGLEASHITLVSGTGSATKGVLSGTNKSWSLAITDPKEGTVTVFISGLDAYSFPGNGATVTIFEDQA